MKISQITKARVCLAVVLGGLVGAGCGRNDPNTSNFSPIILINGKMHHKYRQTHANPLLSKYRNYKLRLAAGKGKTSKEDQPGLAPISLSSRSGTVDAPDPFHSHGKNGGDQASVTFSGAPPPGTQGKKTDDPFFLTQGTQ